MMTASKGSESKRVFTSWLVRGRDDRCAGAGEHVTLKFEYGFLFLHQKDAAVHGTLVRTGCRLG